MVKRSRESESAIYGVIRPPIRPIAFKIPWVDVRICVGKASAVAAQVVEDPALMLARDKHAKSMLQPSDHSIPRKNNATPQVKYATAWM